MLYRIAKGTAGDGGQSPIVYLVSSVERLRELNLQFVFSDGHGLPAITRWFSDPADLERLDWEAIQSNFWADTDDDPDRCRRKQAELLVHRFVPWGALLGLAVINDEMVKAVEARLRGAVESKLYVKVRKDWYYDA